MLMLFIIYSKRRGAINAKQLDFLERYKPKQRLKIKAATGNGGQSCIIA